MAATRKTAGTCFLIGALLAPVGGYAAEAKEFASKPQQAKESADDAAISSRIRAAFEKDEQVSAMDINIETDKGVVTLTGRANSMQESNKAVSIARNTQGVLEVKNMLQVSVLKKK